MIWSEERDFNKVNTAGWEVQLVEYLHLSVLNNMIRKPDINNWYVFLGDIDVDAPFLDVNLFNPIKTDVQYADYFGSRCVCHI